jgi:hypothetical protein
MSPEFNSWYSHMAKDGVGWRCSITQDEVQALVDAGRLMDFTRVPRNEEQRKIVEEKLANGGNSWLPESNGYVPTAEEVNEWAKAGFGHDGINQWICVKARAKRLGMTETECKWCKGAGHHWPDEKYAKLYDEFEWIEPPAGEGYQVWENTSEGSPITPVFKTPEELARWCVDNKASSFGRDTATYEQWLEFARGPGWAPSMTISSNGIRSGIKTVSKGV